MAKCAFEMLNNMLNGRFDDEDDAPQVSIEIEVQTAEQVAEAEGEAIEGEEIANDVENTVSADNQAEEIVEEAQMLAKALREEGLNSLALRMIKNNRVYRDIWRIQLPGTESLEYSGRNTVYANQIADQLEARIAAYEESQAGFFTKMADFFRRIWMHIKNLFSTKRTKVTRMMDEVKGIKINQEKAKDKKVKCFTAAQLQDIADFIGKMTDDSLLNDRDEGKFDDKNKDPIIEKMDAIRKELTEQDVTAIASDYTSGNMTTAIRTIMNSESKLSRMLDEAQKKAKDAQKEAAKDKGFMDRMKAKFKKTSLATSKVSSLIGLAMSSFISGAIAVRACKELAKDEKKDDKKAEGDNK